MEKNASRCLICSQTPTDQNASKGTSWHTLSSDKESNGTDICDQLIAQLNIHFVIRKLLQLPEIACEQLISSHGNPSDWGTSYCPECSKLIEEAKEISQQISSMFVKFQNLQQKLQDKVLDSYQENREEDRFSRPNVRMEVRKLCVERNTGFLEGADGGDDSEFEDLPDETLNSSKEEAMDKMSKNSELMHPDYLYGAIKNSPESIPDDLMDFMHPDDDFLDPGSVVQVVSDIGNQNDGDDIIIPKRRLSEDDDSFKNVDLSMQQEFFHKIMALNSSQAKNTVLLPKDKYKKIAEGLKVCKDTGKRSKFISNYYKRYELLDFFGTLTLVRSGTQKRVVAAEDLFHVINSAHVATNHGGRDSMLKHLKNDFFNVTKHQINTFLSLCEECKVRRPIRPRKRKSSVKNDSVLKSSDDNHAQEHQTK